MTLTEFLLARIAEDEYEANVCLDQYRRGDGGSAQRWLRQVTECEAKRRIVAYAITYRDMAVKESSESRRFIGQIMAETAEDSLRALVRVYADHPDYDPAWALDA